jgi:hypothetical protein
MLHCIVYLLDWGELCVRLSRLEVLQCSGVSLSILLQPPNMIMAKAQMWNTIYDMMGDG